MATWVWFECPKCGARSEAYQSATVYCTHKGTAKSHLEPCKKRKV